jgi:molecular chaperone DnaK (HSP70)
MAPMVGIKLANGGFYPVLEESEKISKRLVLTTVRDDQTNVQIDLYRGAPESKVSSSEYIASLVLENIPPAVQGQTDIELFLSTDGKFNLSAMARETSTGEYQSLRINIESLESGDFDMPDFDLQDNDEAPELFTEEPATDTYEGGTERFLDEVQVPASYDGPEETAETAESDEADRRPLTPNPVTLTAFVLFGILILAVLLYLFFQLVKGPPNPPLEAGLAPFFFALPSGDAVRRDSIG